MRLLSRDLRKYKIFEPMKERDADGDVCATGGYKSAGEIAAHLQPVSQLSVAEAFGVELCYMAQAFTTAAGLREGLFIGESAAEYEILTIENWRSHRRLYLRQVTNNERS